MRALLFLVIMVFANIGVFVVLFLLCGLVMTQSSAHMVAVMGSIVSGVLLGSAALPYFRRQDIA